MLSSSLFLVVRGAEAGALIDVRVAGWGPGCATNIHVYIYIYYTYISIYIYFFLPIATMAHFDALWVVYLHCN